MQQINKIGIVGGTGPIASSKLMMSILINYRDKFKPLSDRNNLPLTLINDPLLPDRSYLTKAEEQDLINFYKSKIEVLINDGCKIIFIACNTAHIFFDRIKSHFIGVKDCKILNFIAESLEQFSFYEKPTTVAVLSTIKTSNSGLYHRVLTQKKFHALELPENIKLEVQKIIYAIKAGFIDEQYYLENQKTLTQVYSQFINNHKEQYPIEYPLESLKKVIKKVKKLGAEKVILGCTELGVIAPFKTYENVCIYDSSKLFTERLIEKYL